MGRRELAEAAMRWLPCHLTTMLLVKAYSASERQLGGDAHVQMQAVEDAMLTHAGEDFQVRAAIREILRCQV